MASEPNRSDERAADLLKVQSPPMSLDSAFSVS